MASVEGGFFIDMRGGWNWPTSRGTGDNKGLGWHFSRDGVQRKRAERRIELCGRNSAVYMNYEGMMDDREGRNSLLLAVM